MILGPSVAIGPILPVDVPALFAWSDDAEAARCNGTYRPANWHREEAFWLNAANDPSRVFFAIRAKAGPEIVGFIQISRIEPAHRSAELAIRIGQPANRRRGYGREALALTIDYCWRQLNLSRLWLTVFADNDGANALYRALGFEQEGRLRQAVYIDGAWIDLVVMGLLRADR